jgi:hypothetical protein
MTTPRPRFGARAGWFAAEVTLAALLLGPWGGVAAAVVLAAVWWLRRRRSTPPTP